jgi:hypothetical protein
VNPLRSHWLRLSALLLLAVPIVALLVSATETGIDYTLVVAVTLYVWLAVCVILALVALAGLIGRLLNRGFRALRR